MLMLAVFLSTVVVLSESDRAFQPKPRENSAPTGESKSTGNRGEEGNERVEESGGGSPEYRSVVTVREAPGPGEIPVAGTGSRIGVDLQKLPATMSIKSVEDLRQRGAAQDLNTALYQVPGLSPVWRYGGFQQVRSRGFRAVILNDGRRDNRSSLVNSHPQGGLWGIDRIEVLRGPSAVLYGFGSVGGVVNLVRKQPSKKLSHEADFSGGTGGRVLAHLGSGGPIAAGFSYRIDVGYSKEHNFRDHKMNRLEGNFMLRYRPHRKHRLMLRVGMNGDQYNNDSGLPTVETASGRRVVPKNIPLERRFNTPQDFLKYNRLDFELGYNFNINDVLIFRQRVSYTRDIYEYLSTEGLAYDPLIQPAQVDRTFYFYFHHHWFPLQSQSEFLLDFETGPVQHKGLVAYEFDAMLGAHSDRASNIFDVEIPPIELSRTTDPAGEIPVIVDGRLRADMIVHSVFVQDHLQLPFGFNLLVGERFDSFSFQARKDALSPGGEQTVQRGPTDNRKDHVLTYRAGLVYNGVTGVAPYLSWSTGFKPNSGLGISTDLDGDGVPDFDQEPEKARQVEGGVRFDLFERVNLNLSAYGIWKRNVTFARTMGRVDIAGKVRSRGVEAELDVDLLSWLKISGGFAWVDAKFLEFEIDGESQAGNAPSLVPAHSANLWTSWGPFYGFRLSIGMRVMGRQFGDHQNQVYLPAYGILDAALWYQKGRLSVGINGTNLTNLRRYYVSSIGTQLTPGVPLGILGQIRLSL